MIGTRDPDKPELRDWLSSDGGGVEAGTFAEAAAHGELLVLAVLGNACEDAIDAAGPANFSGKVRLANPAAKRRPTSPAPSTPTGPRD